MGERARAQEREGACVTVCEQEECGPLPSKALQSAVSGLPVRGGVCACVWMGEDRLHYAEVHCVPVGGEHFIPLAEVKSTHEGSGKGL